MKNIKFKNKFDFSESVVAESVVVIKKLLQMQVSIRWSAAYCQKSKHWNRKKFYILSIIVWLWLSFIPYSPDLVNRKGT